MTSELPTTLASLEQFLSATDDQLDDRTPIPAAHHFTMSFNGTRLLQANVMAKLIDMIGDLN